MNLVSIEGVTKQYSDRVLLEKVDLQINAGDRVGLIGRNGSGKSTLLRMIAGEEPPDDGQIVVWGNVRLEFLSQSPTLDMNQSVLDYLYTGHEPRLQLLKKYHEARAAVAEAPEAGPLQEALAAAAARVDEAGAWSADAEARAVLTQLGLPAPEIRLGALSGGQQRRAALARALLQPADLLLLDEPTNHLDADAVAWLEAYLLDVPRALLMVTHDRYFLERLVTRIVELDRRTLVSYPGNYSRYLELSEARRERLASAEAKQQNRLRKELEWLRKAPKARGTKQKARSQRAEELSRISYDRGEDTVAMALASRRLGKRVLQVEGVAKTYGDVPVLRHLDFHLEPGDRVGVVGPNGAGKSTFLDILAGVLKADDGDVAWGDSVEIGYFDQRSRRLDPEARVIEIVEAAAPLVTTPDGHRVSAALMLEWFLFPPKEQWSLVATLSGGERRRLYLLLTLIHRPNVLLLDEPTNDLDIETLQVLEEFLDHFKGCLVVATHDRYFLDRAVDYIVPMEDGRLGGRYPSPFDVFQRLRATSRKSPESLPTTAAGSAPPPQPAPRHRPEDDKPRGLTWNERRELASLEGNIESLETERDEVAEAINSSGDDFERIETLAGRLREIDAQLDATLPRWMELSDRAEG